MIKAINDLNLGVTASFTTAAVAGDAGAGAQTDTGIMISGSVGNGTAPSLASYGGMVKGANATTDDLTGSITIQIGNNQATTVTMAQVAAAANKAVGATTISDLQGYLAANKSLGVNASMSGNNLSLSSSGSGNPALKITSNLMDNSLTSGPAQLGYTATAAYSVGVTDATTISGNGVTDSNVGSVAAATVTPVINVINKTAATLATITFAAGQNAFTGGTLVITANDGTKVEDSAGSGGIVLGVVGQTDTGANLAAYITAKGGGGSQGITGGFAGGVLTITSAGGGASNVTMTATNVKAGDVQIAGTPGNADSVDLGGTSNRAGIATISYTDQAGVSLSGTDLSSQTDAQSTLTSLNSAISSVAAQDGYIGAMINTLNSVSSVLSTQQENVVAAQNAVQATDYATATSNMSKYEILSQTGISALAQANSLQQEVTKLLQ
jgi:flagellin